MIAVNSHKVLIFGVSQYAALVASYLESETEHELIGYVVDDEYYNNTDFMNKPVFRMSEAMKMPISEVHFFCAIGYKSMRTRKLIFHKIKQAGYRFISIISESAYCDSSAKIGENSIIMPNVVVERNVVIGVNNVIWSNSTICHDSRVDNHCFIAANTTVGGNVVVGEISFLGFSSTVLQEINCASETLLGAMSLLTENSQKNTKYKGIPAIKYGTHADTGICIA